MGPASRSAFNSSKRAGDRVLSRSGRLSSVSRCSVFGARPSAARFQAASKRSSASPAGPTRISRTLGMHHVLLEVVAQLLDRAELVRKAAPAHAAAMVRVFDEIAVAQPVAEVGPQL